MKAIILAAGKGTRLLPITATIPKALVPLNGKALIEQVIDALPDTIDTVIITVKYLGHLIKNHVGVSYGGRTVCYVEQPPDKGGTWPSLYATKEHIVDGELFCVLNSDDIFNKEELMEILKTPQIGMGISQSTMPAAYYGIEIDPNGLIIGFDRHEGIESQKLVEDSFANGFYILDQRVFAFEPVQVYGGEFGLPQTLLKYKDTYPLYAHEIKKWYSVNSLKDL